MPPCIQCLVFSFFCLLFRLEYTRQDSSKRKAAESFVDGSSSDFGVMV